MKTLKETARALDMMDAELIRMREDIEKLRSTLHNTQKELRDIDKELKKYKDAEKKNCLVVLPLPLGSMTYKVVPNPREKNKFTYTQHVFSMEDINDYGKTVFLSDTEAMVAAHERSLKG